MIESNIPLRMTFRAFEHTDPAELSSKGAEKNEHTQKEGSDDPDS